MSFWSIFSIAFILDLLIGDPRWLVHPVTIIAKFALSLETISRRIFNNEYVAGLFTAVITIAGTLLVNWVILIFLYELNPILHVLYSIFLIYTSIAVRGLAQHAHDIVVALESNDLNLARERVSMIVGRDTDRLEKGEVVRATLESVGENMVDGILAPIFFIICFGPLGGITYKAISTLDSTFGYKNDRYIKFGFFSAKFDDIAAYIPARLCVFLCSIVAPFFRVSPLKVIRLAWRDGRKHESPNSAYGEVCLATLLKGTLGGTASYKGIESSRPVLGDGSSLSVEKNITQAIYALLFSSTVFALLLLVIREVVL